MTGSTVPAAQWHTLEEPWPQLFAWAEEAVNGRIVAFHRQARWRPAWYLTLDVDGEECQLYARCQREESMPWTRTLSLRREYDIMRVLHEQGVAVPTPIGFCDEPEAILMESVEGRDRFDGCDDDDTRDRVIGEYVRKLAAAHRLDPAAFEAIGLSRPTAPRDVGFMGFAVSERWYRQMKPGPDPAIEFVVSWLHRNIPEHRYRTSWIHFDAGQFLHSNEQVTALMDVEFSCIGDPLADLGAMRMRDTAQPIGNLTHAFATYAEETGTPIDRSVVNFHAVRFSLLTAMLSAGTRADPPPAFDLAQWQAWSLMSLMICLEIIAEEAGYTIDPPQDVPFEPIRNDAVHVAVQRTVDDVLSDLNADDYLAFRLRIVRDLLPGIHRAARAGATVEAIDRRDERESLGIDTDAWADADEQLERFVIEHSEDREQDIVRLLARRLRRQIHLIDPGMRDVRGFRVQPVDWAAVPTT